MADWLILLLKYGGFGAVLVVALWIMGGRLLKRISAGLDSYVSAYAQQSASIDARIANLEKLAEEQARLTRTVEGIKDEIAAEAKSRDNRWEFRKDVYVNLINATTDPIRFYADFRLTNIKAAAVGRNDPEAARQFDQAKAEHWIQFRTVTDTLMKHLHLAKLATADEVFPALEKTTKDLFTSTDLYSLSLEALTGRIMTYFDLRTRLCDAGRKDLWDTPEPGAKVQSATQE